MEATFEYKEGSNVYTIRNLNGGEVEACEDTSGGKVMGGPNSPIFERVLDKVAEGHPEVYEAVMQHIQERNGWTTAYLIGYCQQKRLDDSG